jgi:hypothetical protein
LQAHYLPGQLALWSAPFWLAIRLEILGRKETLDNV